MGLAQPLPGIGHVAEDAHLKIAADAGVHRLGREGGERLGTNHVGEVREALGNSAGSPVLGNPSHGVVPGAAYIGIVVE